MSRASLVDEAVGNGAEAGRDAGLVATDLSGVETTPPSPATAAARISRSGAIPPHWCEGGAALAHEVRSAARRTNVLAISAFSGDTAGPFG